MQETSAITALQPDSATFEFVPDGNVVVRGSVSIVTSLSTGRAFIVTDDTTFSSSTIRVIDSLPPWTYDSTVSRIARVFPNSSMRPITRSSMHLYAGDLGADLSAEFAQPRYTSAAFRNDSSVSLLGNMLVATFVPSIKRPTWFIQVFCATFDVKSGSLIEYVPLEVDTSKPFVQNVDIEILGSGNMICSSFDVRRFSSPLDSFVVVAEEFGRDGLRPDFGKKICVPSSISGGRYVGWLEGFEYDGENFWCVNSINGLLFCLQGDGTVIEYDASTHIQAREKMGFTYKLKPLFRGDSVILEVDIAKNGSDSIHRVVLLVYKNQGQIHARQIDVLKMSIHEQRIATAYVIPDSLTNDSSVVNYTFKMINESWYLVKQALPLR